MRRKQVVAVFLAGALSIQGAFAHPGRTDSAGGHRDSQNVSGLGSYHYHCGGYPAHLHTNGVCPYASVGNYSTYSTNAVSSNAATVSVSRTVSGSEKMISFNGNTSSVNTVIRNGISLIEVRGLSEALGLHLNIENGAIVVGDSWRTLYLYPNSKKARMWDGPSASAQDLSSSYNTTVINGRTYVPARFLVESLGYAIAYDGSTYTVSGGASQNVPQSSSNATAPTKQPSTTIQQSPTYTSFTMDFKYENKTAKINILKDKDGRYLIDAKAIADLCGFSSEIGVKDGAKYFLAADFDTKLWVAFVEGTSYFNGGSAGNENATWTYQATAMPIYIDGMFFVHEPALYTAMGLVFDESSSATSAILYNKFKHS